MNRKIFNKVLFAIAMASVALTSCNEEPTPGNDNPAEPSAKK